MLCFAGLWNYAPVPDPATGELPGTFTIITRPANSLLHKIHNSGSHPHRMPLMLDHQRAVAWLQPELSDRELQEILDYEYPADRLKAWPVNTIRTQKIRSGCDSQEGIPGKPGRAGNFITSGNTEKKSALTTMPPVMRIRKFLICACTGGTCTPAALQPLIDHHIHQDQQHPVKSILNRYSPDT